MNRARLESALVSVLVGGFLVFVVQRIADPGVGIAHKLLLGAIGAVLAGFYIGQLKRAAAPSAAAPADTGEARAQRLAHIFPIATRAAGDIARLAAQLEEKTIAGSIAANAVRLVQAVHAARLADELELIERGNYAGALAPVPVRLADLAANTLHAVEPFFRIGQVEIERELPAKLPEADVDPDRIGLLLTDLFDSALAMTPTGGSVRFAAEVEGECVRFTVTDSGCGMTREELDRVFDRDYRRKCTEERTGTCLGLGLFVARQIAEAHGGQLWAESAQDKGTRFTVELPAKVP